MGWSAFTSRETNLTRDTKINQTNFKFNTASRSEFLDDSGLGLGFRFRVSI